MARDFAKQRKTSSRPPARKATRKRSGSARGNTTNDRQGSSGWRWYGFGVLTGFFLSFLLYLGSLPPVGEIASNPQQAASAPAEPSAARRFHSAMNSAQKAATRSGRINWRPSASSTLASSVERRRLPVLRQPLPLRAARQAR